MNIIKKLPARVLFILACLSATVINAQTPPQGFNYQAIARDATGSELVNTPVDIRVSIRSIGMLGPVQWQETHAVTTNQFGLFTLIVGQGVNTGAGAQTSFANIAWGSTLHFLQIEMDKGTGYLPMGTTQLLSVPYALFSENVKNVDDADADPANELQALSISNDTIYLSNGGFVKVPPDADADPNNELQAVSMSNDTLYLSNGGTVYLGNYLDNTDNQTLSLTGDTLNISNGNNVIIIDNVNDADADSTNELQTLSFVNDTLYLSDGGSIVLPYDSALWSINGGDIYYNSGKVGIGTTGPFYKLDVKGDESGFIASFSNVNTTTGVANGIFSKGDAFSTVNGSARGGLFSGTGGSSGGNTYGSSHFAFASGTSTAYSVYSDATGSTTTGRKYAFYGLGDGYFSQYAGIGTDTLDGKFVVRQDSAADIFNLYDDSVNVFTVVDGGQVGIGTTVPGAMLDVGSTTSTGRIRLSAASGVKSYLEFYDGTVAGDINYDHAFNVLNLTNNLGGIYFNPGGITKVIIDNTGNVGIGTAGPNSKLQVTSGDVYIETQGNGVILRDTDGAGCHIITVNTAGTITATVVPCP